VIHTATANESKVDNLKVALASTFNGTHNLIEHSLKIGVKKFIYISSTQVYAESEGMLTEDSEVQPKSNYALQHYLTEELIQYYSPKFEQGVKVLRVANVFSGTLTALRERSNLVPTSFILEGLKSGKITLKTSGTQNRSFISDISVGNICLNIVRSKIEGFQVINVGSNFQPSILEVANLVSNRLKDSGTEVQVITNNSKATQKSKYWLSSKIIEFENSLTEEALFRVTIDNLIKLQKGEM
jgi:UDP-glucose 4-epimerase